MFFEVVFHVDVHRSENLVHFTLLLQLCLVCFHKVEGNSRGKFDLGVLKQSIKSSMTYISQVMLSVEEQTACMAVIQELKCAFQV